jgi:flagellar hook assembly protein FlgD
MSLSVFDARGRRIAVLLDEWKEAGLHQVIWRGHGEKGQSLPSGSYLLRLNAGGESISRKLLLIK